MRAALEASIERLGVDHVDLYQIHGPDQPAIEGRARRGAGRGPAAGLTKAVGVSNYSIARDDQDPRRAGRSAASPLATNQVEYSLLRRVPETGGLLDACRRTRRRPARLLPDRAGPTHRQVLGGQPAARQARLLRPPDGPRSTWSSACVRRIGETHDRTPAQVALRWLIEKGAVPIPGAKNADQASQNAGALGWSLTSDEVVRARPGRAGRQAEPRQPVLAARLTHPLRGGSGR